jgi:hypothetical protein
MQWLELNNPARTPAHWTEIIHAPQYAIFILNADTRLQKDGVWIAENLDEARAFAKDTVTEDETRCCEIYTHEGKSGEPVETVYNPAVRGKYEGKPYAKREALIGGCLVSFGIVLMILDAKHDFTLFWGYIIGAKLTIVGGSYLVRGVAGLVEHRRTARQELSYSSKISS